MDSESNDFLSSNLIAIYFFFELINIFCMKYEVCVCNISMQWKICCLHDGIKTVRLHHLINHNINLNDPWLRTVEHNSFQTLSKLSESKKK